MEPSVGQVAVGVVVKHERKGLKNHHEAVRREAGGGGVDPRNLCVVPWEAVKEEKYQYIHVHGVWTSEVWTNEVCEKAPSQGWHYIRRNTDM